MKVTNPKTTVPSGMKLNDKDYMTHLLTTFKNMEKNYVIAMSEASNETLYAKYKNMFKKIADMQRKTYELMFENGWYEMETVENKKLNEKYNTLSKDADELKK